MIPNGASAGVVRMAVLNQEVGYSRAPSLVVRLAAERKGKKETGGIPVSGRRSPALLKASPLGSAWGVSRTCTQKRLPMWGDSKAKGRVELSPLFVDKRGVSAPQILREEKIYLWQ
jgi:hypothetical protein